MFCLGHVLGSPCSWSVRLGVQSVQFQTVQSASRCQLYTVISALLFPTVGRALASWFRSMKLARFWSSCADAKVEIVIRSAVIINIFILLIIISRRIFLKLL